MPITLVTSWEQDVIPRYGSLRNLGSGTQVESIYSIPAQAEVQGYLAGYFTTPFSSNNVTAKDIIVDMIYLKAGNFKLEERKELSEIIYGRMDRLREGLESMTIDDGTTMVSVGETIFSTTENYHPVFGMDDSKFLYVDSSQLYDEASARGEI